MNHLNEFCTFTLKHSLCLSQIMREKCNYFIMSDLAPWHQLKRKLLDRVYHAQTGVLRLRGNRAAIGLIACLQIFFVRFPPLFDQNY